MRVELGSENWPQSPDQGVKTEVRESQRSKPRKEGEGTWPEVRAGSGLSEDKPREAGGVQDRRSWG